MYNQAQTKFQPSSLADMIKSQGIIDSALRVNQTKLKMKFIYFSTSIFFNFFFPVIDIRCFFVKYKTSVLSNNRFAKED